MHGSTLGRLPGLLAAAVVFIAAPAAALDKTCALEASGEACVYDISVTAAPSGGKVTLCSIPGATGFRLRNTTARAGVVGAVSNVGTTTAGSCSGAVAQPVVAGGKYEAIVTYESPLPGSFPRNATARFTGSSGVGFTVSGPRPQAFVEPQTCSQINESMAAAAADVDTAVCGGLYRCQFQPANDTDNYKWTVPAGTVGWIKISGPDWSQWCLYANGTQQRCSYGEYTTPSLPSGTHSIVTRSTANAVGEYYLSVQGVSSSHRCGSPIQCGDVKRGVLQTKADTDTFGFTASAAMTLNLSIMGPDWVRWCVFGPTGNRIQCSYNSYTATLPSAGAYTIGIESTANATGGYTLSLQCL